MKATTLVLLSLFVSSAVFAGAWGDGGFENDAALDWVSECTESGDVSPVTRALNDALKAEYIEAPEGSAAIVAAEVIAAALGKPNPKLPSELRAWVKRQQAANLVQLAPLAKKALVRIQDPEVSELKQLWSEGKPNNWPAAIAELSSRLGK
jgi:hypothetical protein